VIVGVSPYGKNIAWRLLLICCTLSIILAFVKTRIVRQWLHFCLQAWRNISKQSVAGPLMVKVQ
jgi:hypothetical protein